ncbi:MAG: protein kinase [Planctomycetes bacterium]|nr:protein kinase [Planctomycetota bacterium]
MSTSERHKKISDLFLAACELPPEEHAAYLDEACAGDAQLRAEIEALLAQDSAKENFLRTSGGRDMAGIGPDEGRKPSGRQGPLEVTLDTHGQHDRLKIRIEGYDIIRELHRGGQGVVYQAIEKATKRKVAIKVLIEGPHASKTARKRFEREIELVAQLKHPNIISIFHSGETPEGMRYCVMDYIRGVPMDKYVHENDLSLEDRLKVFSTVCDAVQYAHQKGVIHRDLKPSNILVDSAGNPKVLDFGLAKVLTAPVETVISLSQQVIGTLPYMSPEQARGNPDDIDTRTDIYALGIILYEMLTGHYPYPVAGQMAEVLKHIAETPPTPPSRQWTADSGVTRRSSKHLRAGKCPIDDDLQTVVLKTLSKERERRYQSAGELAKDIQHYLADEAIDAKRDSGWYVFRKTIHRHQTKLAVAAGFVMLVGSFGTYIRWNSLREAERQAAHETQLAEERVLADRQKRSRALVARAQDMDGRGRRELAWSQYEEAMLLDPENHLGQCLAALWKKKEYFNHRAHDYRDTGLLEEASELCSLALQRKPTDVAALNLQSTLLYSLGKLDEAEQACRRIAELKPEFHYADTNLAKILAMQGRFEEALESALAGTRKNDAAGEETKFDDEAWRALGTLQLMLGQAEAVDSLNRAKQIDKRDTRTGLLLARLYLSLPGHEDAAKALDEAKLAATFTGLDDPRFDRILAQAHLANGAYDDAARHAAAALKEGDNQTICHLISAVAQAKAGDVTAAREQLDEAIENWPPEFKNGKEVLVTAEKGLLWFDTLAEFQSLRGQAERLLQTSASASP